MLTLTVPSLTQPELPHVRLGLLTGGKTAPSTAPRVKDDNLAALVEALRGAEDLFVEARRLAEKASDQQVDYKRRAEQAEAEKTHLEEEANRLRTQLAAMEQRVPRWVRRIFGATATA